MKIGFFGGTFNPIHVGHIIPCLYLIENHYVDKIYYILNPVPPHKTTENIISKKHRMTMLRKAIQKYHYFDILDIEKENNTPNYTIHTFRNIKNTFNNNTLFFIIGKDMFDDIPNWYQYKKLLDSDITFIVFNRRSNRNITHNLKFKSNPIFINNNLIDISSANIRNRIKNNLTIELFVPDVVQKYIIKNKLYLNLPI